MKYLKKLFWIAALASALFSAAVFSCGWSEPEYFYHSRSLDILYGELVKQHFERRRSYFPGSYNSDEYDEGQVTETYNLQAWSQYLKVSAEDARAIVYERAEDKLASQPPAVKTYLGIVAKQEPLANQGDPRWLSKEEQQQQKAENATLGKAVSSEINQQLASATDPFLRQRYAYLLIRLLHYTGQYAQAISEYSRLAADIQQPDKEVAIWTGLLYAGALQREGKRAEAAYQFATLLAKTDTKKLQAQVNFSIKTDAEWDALMALCKNEDEKALMHFVRALRVDANSLAELKSVYALAPDSDWFDTMLFRELEFAQFADRSPGNEADPWLQAARGINRDVLISDLNAFEEAKTEEARQKLRERRSQYLGQLSQLVEQVRQDKKRKDLFLTDYAAIYLKVLSAQPVSVADVQNFVSAYPNDPRLAYAKPLQHLVYLETLGTLDAAGEAVIADNLTAVEALEKPVNKEGEDDVYTSPYKRRTQDIMTYTYAKLEPLYAKALQPGKAYLAKRRGDIALDAIKVDEIRELQALQAKPSPNRLEQRMVADFSKAFGEIDYETNKFVVNADPSELIARKYLASGVLDKAKAAATEASGKLFKTTYNPFDSGRSGNNRGKAKAMTLLEVIDTLQDLTSKVSANPADAQTQFLLGTAYYNMSWFGNSPMLIRTERSPISWKKGETDLSKAREHYQLALQHATDRELKAKTLYALAKIEQDEFYMQQQAKGVDLNDHWPHVRGKPYAKAVKFAKKNGYGTYFRQIRAYEDTQYYKDVINQCADYRYYFGR
ncbi:MAG TPA: hypothetical protein PLE99_02300 [Candidatus Thiothrix moscowensis]|uniref:hypothetical protein n=1 Tax=unclassified Thiothrix TaxID=2636184 RepID=UPI0025E0F30F|nr:MULTISPECIES: hypothetical protein [unclassified Thiothrix]HRJ51571.1 hypothetical protein [Candidatus Thiothrix moscowensis]HRJ91886.1 hypothetical protein [Candidatus Thiothrix moscowensis]